MIEQLTTDGLKLRMESRKKLKNMLLIKSHVLLIIASEG